MKKRKPILPDTRPRWDDPLDHVSVTVRNGKGGTATVLVNQITAAAQARARLKMVPEALYWQNDPSYHWRKK